GRGVAGPCRPRPPCRARRANRRPDDARRAKPRVASRPDPGSTPRGRARRVMMSYDARSGARPLAPGSGPRRGPLSSSPAKAPVELLFVLVEGAETPDPLDDPVLGRVAKREPHPVAAPTVGVE